MLNCDGKPELLFSENETNARRLYGQTDAKGFFKDAFNEYVVHGDRSAVKPRRSGTKAGALYRLAIPSGESAVVRLRLAESSGAKPFADFDKVFDQRRRVVNVAAEERERFVLLSAQSRVHELLVVVGDGPHMGP